MKIHSRISLFSISLTLFLALTFSDRSLGQDLDDLLPEDLFDSILNQSFSQAAVSIHPADSIDSSQTITNEEGYIQFNPNLDQVVSNEEYAHTNSIEVDLNTGSAKGYSGYRLDTARAITRTENMISTIAGSDEPAWVANVAGHMLYDATVSGPEEDASSFLTILIDVEGSFNYAFGAPALALGGVVSISLAPGGDWFNSTQYVFGGQYMNSDDIAMTPDAGSIFMREDLQVFLSSGEILLNPTLPNIHTEVQFIGQDPKALSMRVSLTIPIQAGDRLILGGSVAGGATHAFLEDFSEIAVGDTGEVNAASGYVDFLNSATIGIELPEGYALEGEGAPPLSIISSDDGDGNDDGWETISGTITYNGSPVCAMALANGQYMFTCKEGDDLGKYKLSVPLDSNEEVTLQAFVSGLAPFRQVTDDSNLNNNIAMQASDPDSKSPTVTTVTASDASTPSGWARITGTVKSDGAPLCAMVLANGQQRFSCGANNGVYDLIVPLDGNGQITLFVFVSGLQPYKQTFTP